jgi:curved DNA-binding protein CbpA
MQDYYEILQVHPKADQDTIRSAYERLCQRYDPEALNGAAEELVEIARRKREDVERAYDVLSNDKQRAVYDEGLQTSGDKDKANKVSSVPAAAGAQVTTGTDLWAELEDDDLIDYRPLPPAHGQDRPHGFDAQPYLSPQEVAREAAGSKRMPFWGAPAAVAALLTFVVGLSSLLITGGGGPKAMPIESTPRNQQPSQGMSEADFAHQFQGQIAEARQVVEQVPDNPNAWINLGNVLYDSVQIVKEHLPDSETYESLLPRWLEASEAYQKALELEPNNATVRSDMAVSLCNYGVGVGEQEYVDEGLEEARHAIEDNPEDPRALLNIGICLVSSRPPQTEEALKHWRKILVLPDAPEGVVIEVQRLMEKYGAIGAGGSDE